MNGRVLKEAADWVIHIAIAVLLALLVITFLGRIAIVEGNSMAPTLRNNNVLIIQSLTKWFGEIRQGDIVALRIPELLADNEKYAIKRIIATENQHVEIKDGMVFVDGKALSEGYINGVETLAVNSPHSDIVVPKGCIYVLGDNRLPDKSRDSRIFGPVNLNRIVGKCLIRIFPFSDAGVVN